MENNKYKAIEWFEKANHDFDALQDVIRGSGHADVAGVLLQQSIEKYIKGYLISKGWKLVKTHDLKQLLDEAVKYNAAFKPYYDLLDLITEYYFEGKYPFSETKVSLSEIKKNLKSAQELIKLIQKEFKEK
jgi:HEPN domain-containing protein